MNPYSTRTHLSLITILVLVVSAGTLGNYFVADDLWQVHYFSQIMGGQWHLFWRNFTGSFIELPGAEFYRPVLGITYLIDCALSSGNPVGWHLTSICLYLAVCCLLYFVIREFTAYRKTGSQSDPASLIAFFSTCLFAATPLHCEAVSWISGRADVLAAFFYLGSIYLFFSASEKDSLAKTRIFKYLASLSAYALALGSKEIAICLPAVILFSPLVTRAKPGKTLLLSLPYLLVSVLYLVLRLAVFGTILGGYQGGFGRAKSQYIIQQWLDPQIWMRLPFPVNIAATGPVLFPFLIIGSCLSLLLFLLIVRAVMRSLEWSQYSFVLVWLLSTLVPLLGIWGIDPMLHNSRLVFFLTMPMAVLFPLLLLQPDRQALLESPQEPNPKDEANPKDEDYPNEEDNPKKDASRKDLRKNCLKAVRIISALIFVILTGTYLWLSLSVNRLWSEAGHTVSAVRKQCESLALELAPGKSAIILGIPEDNEGAFEILNGSTFHHLLSPPLTQTDLSGKLLTFKPFVFGPETQINPSRLRTLLSGEHPPEIYVWDRDSEALAPLRFESRKNLREPLRIVFGESAGEIIVDSAGNGVGSQAAIPASPIGRIDARTRDDGILELSRVARGSGLEITNLSICPLDLDYIEFAMRASQSKKNSFFRQLTPVIARWNHRERNSAIGAIPSNRQR
ncbi:MAG: hypothetical protein KC777_19045, partial [Cyanobacteria bacterium HKST-UBA02]|nr:hypothetical protein [Cyanobacteria bacterium HKST-UBA02]